MEDSAGADLMPENLASLSSMGVALVFELPSVAPASVWRGWRRCSKSLAVDRDWLEHRWW